MKWILLLSVALLCTPDNLLHRNVMKSKVTHLNHLKSYVEKNRFHTSGPLRNGDIWMLNRAILSEHKETISFKYRHSVSCFVERQKTVTAVSGSAFPGCYGSEWELNTKQDLCVMCHCRSLLNQQRAVQTNSVLCPLAKRWRTVTMRQHWNLPAESYTHITNVCTTRHTKNMWIIHKWRGGVVSTSE